MSYKKKAQSKHKKIDGMCSYLIGKRTSLKVPITRYLSKYLPEMKK